MSRNYTGHPTRDRRNGYPCDDQPEREDDAEECCEVCAEPNRTKENACAFIARIERTYGEVKP